MQSQEFRDTTRPARKNFIPVVTLSLLILNALTVGLQHGFPSLLDAFRRDPVALAAGEWWRLITPMFVDPDPLWVIGIKFIGLALIGPWIERKLGGLRWLLVYFLAGVVGEIAGYRWDPNGAGLSLPLFGLIGALLLLLHRKDVVSPQAVLIAMGLIAGVLDQAIGGITVPVLLSILLGIMAWFLFRHRERFLRYAAWLGTAGLLGAGVLTVLPDIHGPALIAGFVFTVLIMWLVPNKALLGSE